MESVMREQWPTVPVPSPQLAVSVPQPLPLEVLGSHHRFVTPIQRITSEQALASWLSTSTALRRLLTFIQSASVAVANKPNSASNVAQVAPVNNDRLISWDQHESHTIAWQIEHFPPLESPQRFGNRAFADWLGKLEAEAPRLMVNFLPEHLESSSSAAEELSVYFALGFGNGTRIDYGSGHELAFVAWLACLRILGVLKESDMKDIVLCIFNRYLRLIRKLQETYRLEPAGSHGVWGLDDFQFLSYYWGSSQLFDHPKIRPKSIMQEDIVEYFAKEYMYLDCIRHIHEVKKGPFFEHSPILYDISGVPTWAKVNSGLLKMYLAEVLGKYPVVQHFPFGSLLPFEDPEEAAQLFEGDADGAEPKEEVAPSAK